MKKIFFFYATCLLSLFTGCAPKVITTISNSHHPATSATQVKKIFFFYATCLLSLFTGCAPKVITTISNSHHPATSATQVRVYGVNDSVPQEAELIGYLQVVLPR